MRALDIAGQQGRDVSQEQDRWNSRSQGPGEPAHDPVGEAVQNVQSFLADLARRYDDHRLETTMRALDAATNQTSDVGREQERWASRSQGPGVPPPKSKTASEQARRDDTTDRALEVARNQTSDVKREQERWGKKSPADKPPKQRKAPSGESRRLDTTMRALDTAKAQRRWPR